MKREVVSWPRRALYLGIGLPISIVTTTLGAVFGAMAGTWGMAMAALVALPVLALVLLILIPVFALVFLAVGLGLAAAILRAPFRPRPDRKYLHWEHCDDE